MMALQKRKCVNLSSRITLGSRALGTSSDLGAPTFSILRCGVHASISHTSFVSIFDTMRASLPLEGGDVARPMFVTVPT